MSYDYGNYNEFNSHSLYRQTKKKRLKIMEEKSIWLISHKALLGANSPWKVNDAEWIKAVCIVHASSKNTALNDYRAFLKEEDMTEAELYSVDIFEQSKFDDGSERSEMILNGVNVLEMADSPVYACTQYPEKPKQTVWLIEHKATLSPSSALNIDGSEWVEGTCIVPATNKPEATELFNTYLTSNNMELIETRGTTEIAPQTQSNLTSLPEDLRHYVNKSSTEGVITYVGHMTSETLAAMEEDANND